MTVWPTNDPLLVDEIIKIIGTKDEEPVKGPNGNATLREALFRDCRITQTTPKFLKAVAGCASAAPLLNDLLKPERKQDLDTYLWGMEVIDFWLSTCRSSGHRKNSSTPVAKLMPRMYSISSSVKAYRPSALHD